MSFPSLAHQGMLRFKEATRFTCFKGKALVTQASAILILATIVMIAPICAWPCIYAWSP